MSIKAVLFDLDGTLLPMDQEAFTHRDFKLRAVQLAPYGYDPKELVSGIWTGTKAMVMNDGSCTNEEAFWDRFSKIFGDQVREHEPVFAEFYRQEFQGVKNACGYVPAAAEVVTALKERGIRVILATNPIFPAVATESRIRWAGLQPGDFESYTTYENSRFCKPNPAYYRDILRKADLQPEECVMVGNDVTEDMVAGSLGMRVFLLTDCIINNENKDISVYPNGGFPELKNYLNGLLAE